MKNIQDKTLDYKDLPYIVQVEDESADDGIRIYDLTVKTPGHNPVTLLENVDLHLKKGGRYVVTGDSGSGKTITSESILGIRSNGSGLVVTPKGVKIMPMSQQPYFPNTDMRGILNMEPSYNHQHTDRELADMLSHVGLDRLIEQIPGQKVRLIIDELIQAIPDIKADAGKKAANDQGWEHLSRSLLMRASELTDKNFRTVQYVPQEQKDRLRESLEKTLKENGISFSEEKVGDLAGQIVEKIDYTLSEPACRYLEPFVADSAYELRGKIVPYTPSKITYFTKSFEKRLKKRLEDYLANRDTDDKNREIRLSESQAMQLAKEIVEKMHREAMLYAMGGAQLHEKISLRPESLPPMDPEEFSSKTMLQKAFAVAVRPLAFVWQNRDWPGKVLKKIEDYSRQSKLSYAFHLATWPLSAGTLYLKANKASRELTQSLSFFMESQIVRGEKLNLSGGERQKLTIAQILLHKPDVLFMDEITAALNKKAAEKLYRDIINYADKDTIIVSIAHNAYIIKHHTHHLHLANKKVSVKAIAPKASIAA